MGAVVCQLKSFGLVMLGVMTSSLASLEMLIKYHNASWPNVQVAGLLMY